MFEHVDLSMLADFYEFTMADGFFSSGLENRIAYFDTYFRAIPDNGGYAIMAGTEPLMEYLNNFSFSEDDIAYFRSKQMFSELFLDYLKHFKFTCDVWAVPEGTPVFPGEPLVIVRGPIVQAQLLETMILLTVNHQSLIATKANRIVRAAAGGLSWNSAHGGHRVTVRQCMAPAPLILQAVLPPPAPSPTRTAAFRQPVRWRIAGCRCSPANWKRSALMRKNIPPTACCW